MRSTWFLWIFAGACTVSSSGETVGPLTFTVGDPVVAGYAPGQIDHAICVISDLGGTIDVGMPTEGTITPASAEVVSGTPDASCPPTVGASPQLGFAVFHWKTATGHANAPFTHSKGNLATTPVDIELNGEAFAGYSVTMPNPAQSTGNYQLLTVDVAYRNPESPTMTVPAPHVPYTVATVPALMVLFPAADKQQTDMTGSTTVAISPPAAQTAVFLTPQGGDPVLLTTIHP
jgi:hypothetical protein